MCPRPPSSTRREHAGHTLVELVIAAGVVAIIGTLLTALMGMLVRSNSRGASDVETERFARIALAHLTEELREAPGDGQAFATWPQDDDGGVHILGFVSPRQEEAGRAFAADPEGRPRWRTAVYYVHDRTTKDLRRTSRAWTGTLADPPMTGGRVMARGVKRLDVMRRGDLITIIFALTAGARDFKLETAVRPRN